MIKNVAMLGEVCNKLGMTLLYHNHDFEFTKLDGKYALDILYEEVPASLLQTELDTCWVNVGGEDPAAYLTKYSGRAPVLHLKDFVGSKSENMYKLIGIDDKEQSEAEREVLPSVPSATASRTSRRFLPRQSLRACSGSWWSRISPPRKTRRWNARR